MFPFVFHSVHFDGGPDPKTVIHPGGSSPDRDPMCPAPGWYVLRDDVARLLDTRAGELRDMPDGLELVEVRQRTAVANELERLASLIGGVGGVMADG